MKKYMVYMVLFVGHLTASAQVFSNEWLVASQSYYRIQVPKDGIYRLTASDLSNAGINLATLNPANLQVFYRGVQQNIYVHGQADGTFNNSDYIDFYGKRNDGVLDGVMYTNNDQPHPYYSFYTDTSVYFLTVGSSAGLRIARTSGVPLSGSAAPYFTKQELKLYTSKYYPGEIYATRIYRSDYTSGEGWFGPEMNINANVSYFVNSKNYNSAGPLPQVEIMMVGTSSSITTSGLNHHIRISVKDNTGNYRTIIDSMYQGYTQVQFNRALQANEIGADSTEFRIQIINDLGTNTDKNALAYIKLTYPSTYNVNGGSQQNGAYTGASPARLAFTNYGKTAPRLYDIANNKLIIGNLSAGTFEAMLNPSSSNFVLADSTDAQDASLAPMFRNTQLAAQSYDYLLVTNSLLANSAQLYKNYRSSAAGGAHNVLLVTVQELYDMFNYGQKSPLAIRHFVDFMMNQQAVDPEYLLLLGKGYETDLARSAIYGSRDLVPTVGYTGSDNMITYGINGTTFAPAIAMGRVAANNDTEVENYLNKLIEYESAPKALWQKEVLTSIGTFELNEVIRWRGYVDGFSSYLEAPSMGANVTYIEKNKSAPTPVEVKQQLIDEINEGKLIYMYYGHGSETNTTLNIGHVDEYNNQGKYPLMFYSGCNIGDSYGVKHSAGEEFTLASQKGAIGWVAQSSFGYENYLTGMANIMSRRVSQDNYCQPIGKILKLTLAEFLSAGDVLNIIHTQQQTYQGDPALTLYCSDSPDYFVDANAVSSCKCDGCDITNYDKLKIVVGNCGKATNDPVVIRVNRISPSGTFETITKTFAPVSFSDTIIFDFSSIELLERGTYNYNITIDPLNTVQEINEGNNGTTFSYFNPGNSMQAILPNEFEIVSNTTVTLTAQNENLGSNGSNVLFQIDTIPTFNSGFLINTSAVEVNGFATTNVNILSTNNKVYFWRTRRSIDAEWNTSSFTYVAGGVSGWDQSNFAQFDEIDLENVVIDSANSKFEFINDNAWITAKTTRFSSSESYLGIRTDEFLLSGGTNCGFQAIAAQFDRNTILPFTYTSCITRTKMPFDVANAAGRTTLKNFIRAMPTGNYIAFMTLVDGGQYLKLDSLPYYLSLVGADSNLVKRLTNETPYALVGQKGGWANEDSSYAPSTSINPSAYAQRVITGKWYSGCITSELIGPASSWSNFSYSLVHPGTASNDRVNFSIIGVNAAGVETVLQSNINSGSANISTINATTYPYLKIRGCFVDSTDRSVPQLKNWRVNYTKATEGTVYIDNNYLFNNDTLSAGDTLKMAFKYRNLTAIIGSNINVTYEVFDANGQSMGMLPGNIVPSLAANATITESLAFKQNYPAGNYYLKATMQPSNINTEQYLCNNSIVEPFVIRSSTQPVELGAFTLSYNNGLALLKWNTYSEIDNDRFDVERKLPGQVEFIKIGEVKGAGNSSIEQKYFYTDDLNAIDKGLVYYRLKQVDFDGAYEYSDIKWLNINKNLNEFVLVQPNPAISRLQVILQSNSDNAQVNYSLIDHLGKPVISNLLGYNLPKGTSSQEIDVTQLAAGVYTLMVQTDENIYYQRVVIQN